MITIEIPFTMQSVIDAIHDKASNMIDENDENGLKEIRTSLNDVIERINYFLGEVDEEENG